MVVIQVTDAVAPAIDLPPWTVTLVVVLALLGLVPTIVLAWALDRTPTARRARAAAPESMRLAAVAAAEVPAERSIAVLPFANFSDTSDSDYFSDGITEELIDQLVKVRALRVAARTSSFAFKSRNIDIAEIARQLRVAYVLEGSVRRAGDRLRVTAQLIDASTGFHLWSHTYERTLADVFVIQDEISNAIVSALRAALEPDARASGTSSATVEPGERQQPTTQSVQAYDLYLQGRYLLNRRTTPSVRSAIERLELAIACDPSFARAHAALGEAWLILASATHAVMPSQIALARAQQSTERATELDPTLSDAHIALGMARLHAWHWAGSLAALRHAITLDPHNARAHHQYAWRLTMTGDFDDALAAIDTACQLEPLALPIRVARSRILHFMRRPADAIGECNAILELEPAFAGAHLSLGLALLQAGNAHGAVAALERARELTDTPATASLVAYALGAAGETVRGNAIVDELIARSARDYVSPEPIAGALVGLGRLDEAVEWYERGYDERSPALIYLKVEPLFDPMRSLPRFQALVRNVGLLD